MSNLRKLIESMDKFNASTDKPEAKPIVEGSMLKALSMVSKSITPAVEMAKEYKQFSEGYWDQAMANVEKARKDRAGKPFEKNPASHDKDGVYKGDKDLDGNPVPKEKKVGEAVKTEHPTSTTGHKVIKRTASDLTNPPKAMQNRARGDQKRDSQWLSTQMVKNEGAATKFGVFQRGGSIGGKKDQPMKTFDDKEAALAYCKRINKQLSPGERQYYGIKYVVRDMAAQVKEAMPPAIATATSKMNPGGAAPTAATSAPNSPASSAPTAPGQKPGQLAPKVDPKVAALQKQTMQKNLAAMKVDPAQGAQDMTMPTADKDKMVGTVAPLLQNPAAAKELQNLSNKYKLPGQQQ